MNLKAKFILYFLLIGLMPIIFATFLANTMASSGFQKEVKNRLIAVTTLKKQSIESFFNQKLMQLELFSNNHFIQTTLGEYNADLNQNKINKERFDYYFNKLDNYIRNNINFDKLNYHDLFIINTSGDVIYTFAREDDFNTNLLSGKYRNTNLAQAFKKGLNENSLTDIEIYTPSNKLALFASAPIYDIYNNDKTLGVIVIQANHDNINKVMKETAGLGDSGETYIVGSDYLLKSNLKLDKELTVERSFKNKIQLKTEAITKALAGKAETGIIKDYRGVDVLSCYTKLDIKGLDWVIISELDKAEALLTVNYFLIVMAVFIVILFCTLFFTGMHTATSITKPLSSVIGMLKNISEGNFSIEVSKNTSENEFDELNNAVKNLGTKLSIYVDNLKNDIEKEYQDDIDSKDNIIQKKEENVLALKSKIKEFKDQLKIIYKEVLEGVVIFDINKNKIINVNLAACNMFRYTKSELLAMNIVNLFYSDDSGRIMKEFLSNTKDKIQSSNNISCFKKDGKVFISDIKYSKIVYNAQECLIVFFKDISQQKNTAENIEKLITTLSQDLREPLLAENLVLKYLLKGTYGELTQKEILAVENMLKSNKDLIALLNVILDFHKHEYESLTLNKENTNLEELLNESISELSRFVKINENKLKCNIDKKLPLINVDKKLLKRGIVNLVGNIVDYTSENDLISINAEVVNNVMIIKIINKEKEYPLKDLDRMFKTYYIDSKMFNNIGKGLSLYLSKQIVIAHGGDITVDNLTPEGNQFKIVLPL